ncbi:MAG: hypothetical protein KIS68_12080 [Bauldia sp.]|nr:hypothetical protein [Bauldia sp.]
MNDQNNDSVEAALSRALEPQVDRDMPPLPATTPAAAPPPARPPMPRPHSRVYDHLVEGEDDVIGLIAYALYKQDKRDWFISWKRSHDAEPTTDHVEAFVNGQMTTAQRERYRAGARQVLDSYAFVAVEAEKPLITQLAVAGRVETAVAKIERSRRWWRQLPGILIGGIVAAAIVIGVVAALVAFDVDVASYLGYEAPVTPDGVP